MDIKKYLEEMVKLRASDLHVKAPTGPVYRVDGGLYRNGNKPITVEDVEKAFLDVVSEKQKAEFERDNELDFSYSMPGVGRYRVNAQRQRGSIALAFRLIPFDVPTIDELELPEILKELL
jgi:twitching motility protein PilT